MRGFSKALLVGLMMVVFTACADSATDSVRKAVQTVIPKGTQIDSVRPSPVPGMYEVVYGTEVMYVSADGRYVISGDLADLTTRTNLTEQVRSKGRQKILGQLKDEDLIVFNPKKTDYTVTVFTDIDCGYCTKLHNEMHLYLAKGIKVRYAAFPRTGPNTSSFSKAVAVWCAKDRPDAITRAYAGKVVDAKPCNSPVAKQYKMAIDLNLSGTPAIVLQSGEILPGYLPADMLRKKLDNKS